MKRNLLKTLITISNFALIFAVSPSLGMDSSFCKDEQKPKFGKASHTREKFHPGNLSVIQEYRNFYRQHSTGQAADKVLAQHHDILVPHAQYLLETMDKGKNDANILSLKKEVTRALEDNKVSALWLVDAHFRYLTLLDDMSPEERDVFSHVPHNKYLKALLEKDLQGNPVVLDLYQWGLSLDRVGEYFFESGKYDLYFPYDLGALLSKEAYRLMDQEVVKHLPISIIYPALGEAIFPMEFILNCWMDDVHLLGMPTKDIKQVHGEDASPVGFGFHDLFHYKLDKRRAALMMYILLNVSHYVHEGERASDVIPKVVPLAIEKYQLVMEALKRAHEIAKKDKRTLVGEFFTLHEAPHFSQTLLMLSNPVDVIKMMTEGTVAHYGEDHTWENPKDVLMTSPIDGKSALSADEIKEIAAVNVLQDPSIIFPYQIFNVYDGDGKLIEYVSDPEKQKPIKLKWLFEKAKIELKSSSQFIDVTFILPSLQSLTYSYPTLVRKWKNLDATLAMLKYAGIEVEGKPELKGHNASEDRDLVLKVLDDVMSKIQDTIKDFSAVAIKSFEDLTDSGASFMSDYADKFEAIQKKGLIS